MDKKSSETGALNFSPYAGIIQIRLFGCILRFAFAKPPLKKLNFYTQIIMPFSSSIIKILKAFVSISQI